jgi:dTMP kinase
MQGHFIVFEGIDGCGKSTQAKKLVAYLKKTGKKVLSIREPGGTPLGEKIRDLLLHSKKTSISPRAELFLYMASRAQLVDDVIQPALAAGKIVVCDRFYYSTAAYQGAAGKTGVKEVLHLAEKIARFPKPDRVFLLDLSAKASLARLTGPKDRMEQKGLAYMERARQAFLRIARKNPRIFSIHPGNASPDTIQDEIRNNLSRLLR